MKIIRVNGGESIKGVQKITLDDRQFLIADGVHYSGPLIIESETIVGFMALSVLASGFEHMKCWKEDGNGEDCKTCPVQHNGTCGIIGIKNAAIEEGMATGTIRKP